MTQLAFLFILGAANTVLLLAMSVLFIRTIWCLGSNTTTIEGWEIERHKALLRRARTLGGSLPGPDDTQIRIVKQEFPWDLDILSNICQGMGTKNPIMWFFPFAPTLPIDSGLSFEDNGLEGESYTGSFYIYGPNSCQILQHPGHLQTQTGCSK